MNSRTVSLGKSITSYILSRKYASQRSSKAPRKYFDPYVDRCDSHMNELPVPCGPWDVYYKSQQKYYNRTLVAGALWWLLSLILMLWTNSFYMNWAPPLTPGPPSEEHDEEADEEIVTYCRL